MEFEQIFFNFTLNPTTLLVITFGLVEFAKQLGAKGNRLRLLSLKTGLSLAILFRLSELYPEVRLWVEVAFFGLLAGLGASGIYGFLDQRFPSMNSSRGREN